MFNARIMLLEAVLTIIFATLLVLCLSTKWGLNLKNAYRAKNYKQKINIQTIKRVKPFCVTVPFIDGLYAVYLTRKYGVCVTDLLTDMIGLDDIGKFCIGSVSILFSKNAKISHKLLCSSDSGHLSRPNSIYGKIMVDILQGGLLGTPFDVWSRQRKVLGRAFTSTALENYTETMNKHCKKLIESLSTLSQANNCQIAGEILNNCIYLNTIMITLEFIMGSEVCDRNEAMQFSKDFWEIRGIVLDRLLRPELYAPFLWWFHSNRKRYDILLHKMHEFVRKIVEFFKEIPDNNDGDRVNRCLIEEMMKQNVAHEEMFCQIATFLSAGVETISVALNFLLHHLACHPEYQARCRAEVDGVMEQCIDLKLGDLSKLVYLERFIQESLRITPTIPFFVREVNTPLRIDERCTIENGNLVMIPVWFIHRNSKYYPRPEIFDPDRFLPEESRKREPGTFIPFSGGLRNCIGRRFAMLEMKTILAWILRNFEIHTEDGLHDVRLFFEVTLRPERNFRTTLKIRTTK